MRHLLSLSIALLIGIAHADELSFTHALDLAERNAPQLAVQTAKISAAQSSAIAADALADPKLLIGVENVPVDGSERGSLQDDFMTMQKIGVMQEFANSDKRRARADIASAAIERARAERIIARQTVRAGVAQAWLQRYYLEQQRGIFDALERENRLLEDAVHAQAFAAQVNAVDGLLPREEMLALADRRDEWQRQLAAAIATLRQWIGDDAYLPLVGAAPEWPIAAAELSENVHAHPELAAYGPMTRQAEAELREALAQKKSDWGVQLSYQRRPLFPDMVSLEFTYDLPLFPQSRQNPLIEAKKYALEQLDNERMSMLREHVAQLDSDVAQYRMLDRQLQRQRDYRVPLLQQKLDTLLARYRTGQSDLRAAIDTRREWLTAQLRVNELQSQRAQLAAKLYYVYAEVAP